MTRFLNGPVLNLLLAAGIGLSIYYATTLTEREARSGYSTGQVSVATVGPASRSVNVEGALTEREAVTVRRDGLTVKLAHDQPAVVSRSVNVDYKFGAGRGSDTKGAGARNTRPTSHTLSYWRYWAKTNGRQLRAEHAHVQRLLHQLHVRRPQAHETAQEIIRRVFGAHGDEAVRVADCETGGTFSTTAVNGQYLGLFQLGSWERANYAQGHYTTIDEQVSAAHRYFVATGSDWGAWECQP